MKAFFSKKTQNDAEIEKAQSENPIDKQQKKQEAFSVNKQSKLHESFDPFKKIQAPFKTFNNLENQIQLQKKQQQKQKLNNFINRCQEPNIKVKPIFKFICLINVQNSQGKVDKNVHQGTASNSQKSFQIFKVEKADEAPELYFIIKNFKSKMQETIVEFEHNQISELHSRFKDQGKMTIEIVKSEEDIQQVHQMKIHKLQGIQYQRSLAQKPLAITAIMISDITSEHVDCVINHINSFQKEIYNFNPQTKQQEQILKKDDVTSNQQSINLQKKRQFNQITDSIQQQINPLLPNKQKIFQKSIPFQKNPVVEKKVEIVNNNKMQDIKIILECDQSPASQFLNDIQPIKYSEKLKYNDLSWDCVSIIISYLPLNLPHQNSNQIKSYKKLRLLNRTMYKLICKKRQSVLFQDKSITEKIFIDLLIKCSSGSQGSQNQLNQNFFRHFDQPLCGKSYSFKQLGIMCNLPNIKTSAFNKLVPRFPGLTQLDFSNFTNALGEEGLNRILVSCKKTIQYLALPFQSNALSQLVFGTMSNMPFLVSLYLGNPKDDHQINAFQGNSKIKFIKQMLRSMLVNKQNQEIEQNNEQLERQNNEQKKTFCLKNVSVYECDSELIELLSKLASQSLEKLIIAKFYQPSNQERQEDDLYRFSRALAGFKGQPRVGNQQEIKPQEGFKNLQRLNLCSCWSTLKVKREIIDQQNDQAVSIVGNRQLEQIFFGLKENLIEIHLGQWLYDDLLIYTVEICKKLEIVEINSDKISDNSITQLLQKCSQLKSLDLSGCPNFIGVSFSDAQDLLASNKLKKLILGSQFQGHAMQTAKEKIHKKIPNCVIEFYDRKKYYLHATESLFD